MSNRTRFAAISAVSIGLPETVVTTADLESELGEARMAALARKTGITQRRVSAPDEFASDLAIRAAEALFAEHGVCRASVDYLLVCTQSPDHPMPTTACLVHEGLGLRGDCAAVDLGMGCSGYIYGLSVATGLIESGQVETVLLITADTMTKYLNPEDRQLRTIFGDGAAATLVTATATHRAISGFAFGTDGGGAQHLLVPNGGLADGSRLSSAAGVAERGLLASGYDMYMDGAEVFTFTLREVPRVVRESLAKADARMDDIDLFVFHQANAFMLEALRKHLGIDPDRFVVEMKTTGNTGSSSIPLALDAVRRAGHSVDGTRVMLVGFGVGLSWGAVVVDLHGMGPARLGE